MNKSNTSRPSEMDGRMLFVMIKVTSIWVELLEIYSTLPVEEFRKIVRDHNLGVYYIDGKGLSLKNTIGTMNRQSPEDQKAGLVFYLLPIIGELFPGEKMEEMLGIIAAAEEDALEELRELFIGELHSDTTLRDRLIVYIATHVFEWSLDWECRYEQSNGVRDALMKRLRGKKS